MSYGSGRPHPSHVEALRARTDSNPKPLIQLAVQPSFTGPACPSSLVAQHRAGPRAPRPRGRGSSMQVPRLGLVGAVLAGALALSGVSVASSGSSTLKTGDSTDRALEAGVQLTPKHTKRPKVTMNGVTAPSVNPYLGLVPDPSEIDWAYWKSAMAAAADKRYAASDAARAVRARRAGTGRHARIQRHPSDGRGDFGLRDGQGQVEGRAHPRRSLPACASRPPPIATVEDQGSIPLGHRHRNSRDSAGSASSPARSATARTEAPARTTR